MHYLHFGKTAQVNKQELLNVTKTATAACPHELEFHLHVAAYLHLTKTYAGVSSDHRKTWQCDRKIQKPKHTLNMQM